MKNSLKKSAVGISLFPLALSGCTGKETTAALMRDDASAYQTRVDLKKHIADDWETGTN